MLKHVALIMDGNRRWAKRHRLPIFSGHKVGEERIEPIVDTAIEVGIPYLTFWAFSTENWHRSRKEVQFLLHLYRHNLDKTVNRFHKKNVRLNIIGNLSLFPSDIQKKTSDWVQKTKDNKKITVNIALSYGGRDEIIRAINKLEKERIGKLNMSKNYTYSHPVTPDEFASFLDTNGQPDPDLLIRTGGELRISGFMLWQIEYTELYFTDVLWPDFTSCEFKKALDEYNKRQRRFGR